MMQCDKGFDPAACDDCENGSDCEVRGQFDYNRQSDYRDHCVSNEPTYNVEDGSI